MKNSQIILPSVIWILIIVVFFMFWIVFLWWNESVTQKQLPEKQDTKSAVAQRLETIEIEEPRTETSNKKNEALKFEAEIEDRWQAKIMFNTITSLPNDTKIDLYIFSDAKMDTFIDIIEDIDYSRWYNPTLLKISAWEEELQKVMNQQENWSFETEIMPNREYSFLLYHPQSRNLTSEENDNSTRLVWIDYLKMHNKSKTFFESEKNVKFMFEIPQFIFDENYKKSENSWYSEIKYLPESCDRYIDKYDSKSIRCNFMMN